MVESKNTDGKTSQIKSTGKYLPTDTLNVRQQMYRLMISQLYYDGETELATKIQQAFQPDPPCPPSDRLFNVVRMGLEAEAAKLHEGKVTNSKESANVVKRSQIIDQPCLDLEYDSDIRLHPVSLAPEPCSYETRYVTAHKAPCRAANFSPDGQLLATGSIDASIKLIDVSRMLARVSPHEVSVEELGQHQPVIRTLYDHADAITCLGFHPIHPLLVSGSRDATVKFFDFSRAGTAVKKAITSFTDASPILAFAFHPTGDYMAVATEQIALRIYDTRTAQCYVGANASSAAQNHTMSVTSVDWSRDGRNIVTCSMDGSVKLWDGVSGRCVNTFARAHEGLAVGSVQFSQSGKYVLSCGADAVVKLWERAASRCLIAYTGASAVGAPHYLARATFNHSEQHVLLVDESSSNLCSWDSRHASRHRLLNLGHNAPVRHLSHSPVAAAFVSCSDDFRARFWVSSKAQK